MISRMNKLTTCFIETIEHPGKYYDIHGLFLRVYPAGSKNWYQRLTINGRRHEFGLGNANIKPLSNARKEAFKNLKDSKKVLIIIPISFLSSPRLPCNQCPTNK